MCRYKGELEMALQNDCILWNLELSTEDEEFEVHIIFYELFIRKR